MNEVKDEIDIIMNCANSDDQASEAEQNNETFK